jgi:hypothetical protein
MNGFGDATVRILLISGEKIEGWEMGAIAILYRCFDD